MARPDVSQLILASEAVRAALAEGRPVVALETSVLAQGLPSPRNLEAAVAMGEAVRSGGAEPAWIWIDAGSVRVGFLDDGKDLERVALSGEAAKVARRDLAMALAGRGLGATTVSATLWAAHRVGIQVMATGGIGGVHRGSGDVSADLVEMARTPGVVVCSGPKSIMDGAATLERLEELGVGVLGYRCDRLPFFLVREAGPLLEHRADTPEEVAAAARAQAGLGVEAALLVCQPVPSEHEMDAEEVDPAVEECRRRARAAGVTGKAVTPYLLRCLAERTGGRSLEANVALLRANAALASRIAATMAESHRS